MRGTAALITEKSPATRAKSKKNERENIMLLPKEKKLILASGRYFMSKGSYSLDPPCQKELPYHAVTCPGMGLQEGLEAVMD